MMLIGFCVWFRISTSMVTFSVMSQEIARTYGKKKQTEESGVAECGF